MATLIAPDAVANFPVPHRVQLAALAAEYVPPTQLGQMVAPAGEDLPATQSEQVDRYAAWLNVPAAHSEHSDVPPVE
jgi:hypothetical protein